MTTTQINHESVIRLVKSGLYSTKRFVIDKTNYLSSNVIYLMDPLMYCRPTHMDQYFHFTLHPPLHQKHGVVRALTEKHDILATADKDRDMTKQHIRSAVV